MRLVAPVAVVFACSWAVPPLAWGQSPPPEPHAAAATPGEPAGRRSPGNARGHALAPPDATMSGFETLPDGSTRVYVELSKRVLYDTKLGPGTITYVLKGARVERRNNYNPLVTVHFNTPVKTARLVPHGHDLWFVVTLRENAQATMTQVTMDGVKDGACTLRVDFPKGDYLPASDPAAPAVLRPEDAPPAAPLSG